MKIAVIGLAALAISGCIIVHAQTNNDTTDISELFTNGDIKASEIEGVEMKGGGDLTIRYGRDFSFESTGNSDSWNVYMEDETLVLDCKKPCKNTGHRSAILTIPHIEAFALTGGGDIDIVGDFPDVDEFDIAIVGGGDIHAYDVTGDEVNVAIIGGGDIYVSAVDELNVSIMGGGDIYYKGSPEISKAIMGGGDVIRAKN